MSLNLRTEVWVRASGLRVSNIYLRQECYSPGNPCRVWGGRHGIHISGESIKVDLRAKLIFR